MKVGENLCIRKALLGKMYQLEVTSPLPSSWIKIIFWYQWYLALSRRKGWGGHAGCNLHIWYGRLGARISHDQTEIWPCCLQHHFGWSLFIVFLYIYMKPIYGYRFDSQLQKKNRGLGKVSLSTVPDADTVR